MSVFLIRVTLDNKHYPNESKPEPNGYFVLNQSELQKKKKRIIKRNDVMFILGLEPILAQKFISIRRSNFKLQPNISEVFFVMIDIIDFF